MYSCQLTKLHNCITRAGPIDHPFILSEALRVGYFFSKLDHPVLEPSAHLAILHYLVLMLLARLVGESMVCKSVFLGIDLYLALNGVLR